MDDVTLARELERMAGDIRSIGRGVDTLVASNATKADAKAVEDIERRLRTVEAWMWRVIGGALAVGAGAGALASAIVGH